MYLWLLTLFMIQVIITEEILNTFVHGLCSFLFNASLCHSSCSVACIAEVAKGACCFKWRRHKILNTYLFFLIATINQVVLSLIGIFSVLLFVEMQIS